MSGATVLTCPQYQWCVRHEIDDSDGSVLHLSRSVEYDGLCKGSFHLSAATGGGVPAEPTWVISYDVARSGCEWMPEEALAQAEQLVAVMREFVALASPDDGTRASGRDR